MPEIKHNFTGGKMNKDLDERIVPNGEYRHAMNVQVGTSDDSDVGVIQNILGNKEISINHTLLDNDLNYSHLGGNYEFCSATTIGSIAHTSGDAVYFFNKNSEWIKSGEDINILANNNDDAFTPGVSENFYIYGDLGLAIDANGASNFFLNTTWSSFRPISSSILQYKDNTISPVVISQSVIFKMWDAVIGKSHYDLAASQITTDKYGSGNGDHTVGGTHNNLITNYSYPDLTDTGPNFTNYGTIGSEGFNYGWGIEGEITHNNVTYGPYKNGNKIEISDARGVKVGMSVKGWGANQNPQSYGEAINLFPEDLKVTAINNVSWLHTSGLIDGAPGEPQLAQITLSHNIYDSIDNNKFVSHIEFTENTLGFQDIDHITGINIIGNEIFFTDNNSEPKSINIEDGLIGSSDLNGTPIVSQNTKLVVDKIKTNIELEEKHLAVIKPAPLHAPKVNLVPSYNEEDTYSRFTISGFTTLIEDPINPGQLLQVTVDQISTNASDPTPDPYQLNGLIALSFYLPLGYASYPVGTILYASPEAASPYGTDIINPDFVFEVVKNHNNNGTHLVRILSLNGPVNQTIVYSVAAQKAEPILEETIGRFCLRYIYKNKQYSPLGPWSDPAFLPTQYNTEEGETVNTGMYNFVKRINLRSLIPPGIREDILGLDILYKDSSSPSVFKIDTIYKDNDLQSNWNINPEFQIFKYLRPEVSGQGDLSLVGLAASLNLNSWKGQYSITSKIKKSIIPEIQTLRPWDNVPKKALAQEIVGNRLVYGNYTQGYDVVDQNGSKITLDLTASLQNYKNIIHKENYPYKSMKSFRDYQVGIVFSDFYGRSTPVLTSAESSFHIDMKKASEFNELNVTLNSLIPSWADSYRFYIKGGEEEYYNLIQKGVYLSSEKDTWVSFDSKDRNKITEEDTLTLKVGGITNYDVGRVNSYKVLSISNEIPESIKYFKVRRYYEEGRETKFANVLRPEYLKVGKPTIDFRSRQAQTSRTNDSRDGINPFLNSTHVRISIKEDSDKNPRFFSFLEVDSIHAKGANSGTPEDDLGARWEIILKDPLPEEYQAIIGEIEGNPKNIIFELYEEKQIDNIQFEGRFFVKISADKDFAVAYGGTTSVEQYAIAETVKVFYYKDTLITADDGIYQDPPFTDTTIASVTTVERPYVDAQERWGQFLINPRGYTNDSQGTSSTIKEGYTMDGGALPLNQDDVILGFNNSNPSTGLESVGRSLGHPTAGTWFLDEGDYVGLVTDPDSPIRATQRTFTITGDGGASFLHHPDGGLDYGNVTAEAGTNSAYDSANKVINLSLGGCQASYLTSQFGGASGVGVKRKISPKPHVWAKSWFESTMLNGEFAPGPVGDSGLYRKGTPAPNFISRIHPGSRLRWKEDPTETIYNIKNVGYRALLNYTINDKHGSIEQSSGTRFGTFPAYFRYPHNFRHNWSIELDQTMDNWNPINASPNSALTGGSVVTVTIGSGEHLTTLLTAVPANDSTFFLADAGTDANKLHEGMVLTHYHPSGGSNAAVTNNARIHSIKSSTNTQDNNRATVRIVNDQGNTTIHNYVDGDILTFKQHSMDGSSSNMAERRLNLYSYTNGNFNTSATQYDSDYIPTLTPVAIGYNLEILNATTSVVQQLSGSLSSYTYSVWETSPKNIPDVNLFTEINDVHYPETSSFNLQNIITPGSRVYLATEFSTPSNVINNTSTLDNNYTGNVGCIVYSGSLNKCRKYGYDSEILNYSEFDLSLISVSNPSGALTDIFDSNNVSIVSMSRNSINLSENFITSSLNTDIKLTSNFPYNGGHTIIHRVLGNTIELANANNTQTNAVNGLLKLQLKNPQAANSGPDILKVVDKDKTLFLEVVENVENSNIVRVKIANQNYKHKLNYFNCYSFGNGIESVSVGDEFNKQRLLNNGRISTTIDWDFIEEEIHNGLIYSGIYNPASGLNNLNQFIQADKITKEVNPVYGSIQRLFTRNSDLIAFCEDKVLKILANKDALFNADGNINLTASRNVLGQTMPFAGDYGISKNPQSLASESYRLYFADEKRKKVLRLSMDGLSPISDYGMNDWFRDNLQNAISLEGSFDENKDEYNLTIIKDTEHDSHTVSFSEKVKGWVSFKSFIPEKGMSLGRDYFTFKSGKLYLHHQKRDLSTPDFLPVVEYNSIDQSYITDYNYNNFYNVYRESEVDVILNDGPSIVKSFLSLSYEGTDAKVDKFIEESILSETHTIPTTFADNDYYNIQIKKGWYVDIIETDKEKGSLNEFIEKEGKWFNYIKGIDILDSINEFGQFTNPDNI